MSKREIRQVVDTETGEVKEYVEWRDGDRIRTATQDAFAREKYRRYEDSTDFIWVVFKYGQPFYPEIKVNNIARMVVLATQINTHGFCMFENDVAAMLKLNANLSLGLRNELEEQGIVQIQQHRMYVNSDCFYRGEMCEGKGNHIRLFTDSTKALYDSCNAAAHRYLSYIFRMIPYANRQTNMLTLNPTEQDITHLELLDIKEVCDIVGYDRQHSARLRKELLKLKVNGQPAVGFFNQKECLTPNGRYVIVNPHLFYGGERFGDTYQHICSLFEEDS